MITVMYTLEQTICDGCKRAIQKGERVFEVGPVDDPFTVCRPCHDDYENELYWNHITNND